ncbi:MAG: Cupin 2 conserved barrel domain protein [Verrucomicrobia bacterium]|nr:Cupin 2 conserved barrel domain protein [Verrucomicrobiota bacterium]
MGTSFFGPRSAGNSARGAESLTRLWKASPRWLAGASLWLGMGQLPARAAERLFVLTDAGHVRQFKIDPQRPVTLEKTYSEKELSPAFPATSISVSTGNLFRTYNEQGDQLGEFILDARSNRLAAYAKDPGSVSSIPGRILETPDTSVIFRGANSLYSAKKDPAYAASLLREKFRNTHAGKYRDFFVLDGMVFGTTADHIDRLSNRDGSPVAGDPRAGLTLPGGNLGKAVVSPWNEAFIADTGGKSLQRVVWRNGDLESNGTVADAAMIAPGALAFDPDGELFVTSGAKGANAILRFRFVLDNFVTWRAVPHGGIEVENALALDLALAKPVGYVLSEATNPLVSQNTGAANGHHGIAQTILLSPDINSETAVIALVQYEPGGYTVVHKHPQMEQVEIVVDGRALWEVGEFEREVGPGDVVFCPRNVKHGYKVIGDKPFKFYQVEWREWAINH